MESPLFTPLPSPKSRWKLFVTGWSVQAVVLAFILATNALFPQTAPRVRKYVVTSLVAYIPSVSQDPLPAKPLLIAKPRPIVETPKTLVAAKLVVPAPRPKPLEAEIKAPDLKIESKLPSIPGGPAPKLVATNTFSTDSSAIPSTPKLAAKVQTGGFGDPNGVPAAQNRGPAINITKSGSFDLPAGSGRGNGLGGATPGVVVSAGFSNEVAIGGPKSGSVVRQSGFDSRHYSAPGPHKLAVVSGPPTTPVEILSKPKPDYTEEGRKLRIDGEVRLEVLFSTDGQVHVIRVLQGLGYGLDQQAVKAAEQIKFKPALHEGQPIDSRAVVHIVFEMAS